MLLRGSQFIKQIAPQLVHFLLHAARTAAGTEQQDKGKIEKKMFHSPGLFSVNVFVIECLVRELHHVSCFRADTHKAESALHVAGDDDRFHKRFVIILRLQIVQCLQVAVFCFADAEQTHGDGFADAAHRIDIPSLIIIRQLGIDLERTVCVPEAAVGEDVVLVGDVSAEEIIFVIFVVAGVAVRQHDVLAVYQFRFAGVDDGIRMVVVKSIRSDVAADFQSCVVGR